MFGNCGDVGWQRRFHWRSNGAGGEIVSRQGARARRRIPAFIEGLEVAPAFRLREKETEQMATARSKMENPKVVPQAEWLAARKELLTKEKQFTKLRDDLSRQRRELPWEKVEKNYVFDGPNGKVTLSELFGNKSQLIIYHFMFGPDWKEGCPSCSLLADHFDGSLLHLAARDVRFAAVSRAPLAKIETFKKRMGWMFNWVSSNANDFNRDYHVSFTKDEVETGTMNYNYTKQKFPSEEGPGASVFYKDNTGVIYHTYSSYGRGLDIMIGAYNWLDIAPKGRDEEGLPYSMAWVRHHDRYELADADKPYWPNQS
jgi:predicted dithiol-disulfide oxidoreductase (DUF899 family)